MHRRTQADPRTQLRRLILGAIGEQETSPAVRQRLHDAVREMPAEALRKFEKRSAKELRRAPEVLLERLQKLQ